jgi:hypothetical protein
LVAEHNVENDCYTCLQEETLKIQEDGIKKVVAQNKGYQFKKIQNASLLGMSRKAPCTSRLAGREIDGSQYPQDVEENNKRYQENPQLCRTRQAIKTYIRYYKDNRVTITLI